LSAAILENLTTAVLIVTPETRVVFMNAGAESLLGVSRKQARDRQLTELLPGLEALDELIGRALRDDQSFGQSLTFSVPHHERSAVEVVCRVSPFRRSDSDQLLIEFVDATQWRQIDRENTLISQRGVSRRIIRQLAHEIRNPLGGLRGAAQLLERQLQQPELREYTRVIVGETDRLVALTNNLLGPTGASKIESVNVHELIERVLLLLQGDEQTAAVINRDYDPSLPNLSVDKDQIVQALLNIARNAVQASGLQGNVTVRTRVLTNYVIGSEQHRLVASVEVEDNGPGIPEDLKASIFYPLVTSRDEGTGLGLPLAQDLVSRHGGLVEYESEPGRTVFMVQDVDCRRRYCSPVGPGESITGGRNCYAELCHSGCAA
jgi:two-component system nitrogen regulation sensor histidine kinase GlnL